MLSRRSFISSGLAAGLVSQIVPAYAVDLESDLWSKPRWLWLRRPVTGEEVRVVYFADGKVVPRGYGAICALLRDVRENQAIAMDITLLDILYTVQSTLKINGVDLPLNTNSGFRTIKTNEATEGAAKNSEHTMGRAWDGHVADVSTQLLSALAARLRGGGVGFYPGKKFTHIDSGNVRLWRG